MVEGNTWSVVPLNMVWALNKGKMRSRRNKVDAKRQYMVSGTLGYHLGTD